MKTWINLKCEPQNKNLSIFKTIRHIAGTSEGWAQRREAGLRESYRWDDVPS